MTVHFYLVRHGQTQLNRHHRLQGITDSPLTKKGIRRASKLGIQLRNIEFASVYTSDLRRTQETARIILSENQKKLAKIISEPGLREISFGNFEEMKNRHMVPNAIKKLGIGQIFGAATSKKRVTAMTNLFGKMDEGAQIEDAKQLNARITRTLSAIGKQYTGQDVNILIVAHALILSLFIENLSGDVPLFLLKNARVSQVDYDGVKFKIVNVNKKKSIK
ncbi:histidine phosphatase family protein [Liquorilactobacillus mali]|uniref:histidine phosphatase family protein n=1 Tax=Liquorilactobacillus mali TaxID=1618 RepID=UPI002955B27A|nr:histidine phosphatase family protein [Liquorilactobacillus mali]MDV7757047.1 histidine phosphatase family protein [Liquorilactobacillus mali]